MRQIKFRAWDGKEMTYSKNGADIGFWKFVSYDSETIIMQFTGLTDKNGVEIYEGDVLYTQGATEPEENGFTVFWNEYKWSVIMNNKTYPYIFDINGHLHQEVIGNIYENPELLNPTP